MDWRVLVTVAHVVAAFWFVAGYVGTNVLTEVARRATTHDGRVAALAPFARCYRGAYELSVVARRRDPVPRPLSVTDTSKVAPARPLVARLV